MYSNIVEPRIVGHISIPLLKIIPINIKSPEKGSFVEFDTLEYFPVALTSLRTIQFEIRTHDGDLLSMDKEEVLLTLTFVKNPKPS